eukprot:TRINITY_DN1232_c0_g1_i1.p1 TRINITY_DN1232_c0_g1~~TRINITY_DN1232_c0_g1_i1.p1  ORF type:complete len:433 (-),score=97.36 TRINITY_DN1232_c0_g1_i1:124-1422(-)
MNIPPAGDKATVPTAAGLDDTSDMITVSVGDRVKRIHREQLIAGDVNGVRQEYLFECPQLLQRFLKPYMKDLRDMPMIHLLFNMHVTTLPFAVLLFTVLPEWHVFGVLYFLLSQVLYLQRFILFMHFSTHRKIFEDSKVLGWILNRYIPNFMSPFYGIPPGMYFLHHIVMHHCENNLFPYDVSSTEPFRRDNIFHFLFYYLRYLFAFWFDLPYHSFRRKRWGLFGWALGCLFVYFPIIYLLWTFNALATFYVFLGPMIFCGFALMFGNFSQHIFVDPDHSRDNYNLTINCINCEDNMRSFNDGYHIIHHLNSKLHWTELPKKFLDSLDEHTANNALIFEGIQFAHIGLAVFTGRLAWLADHVVQIGEKRRTKEELVELMKRRLVPIHHKSSMTEEEMGRKSEEEAPAGQEFSSATDSIRSPSNLSTAFVERG